MEEGVLSLQGDKEEYARDFVPHPHQGQIIGHIQRRRRAGVWAGMGSGKTVSTATALDQLDIVEPVWPAIIFAPLRVARSTWVDEIKKWAHLSHLRVSVITGTERQRMAALRAPADIYATNYEQIPWLIKVLGDKWPFRTIVADEWTRLKSFRLRQGGSRAQALSKVAFLNDCRFIGLTGTPAPNGLKDLWGQMYFVDKGERLGRSFSAFEMRWFRKGEDGFSLQPMAHAQGEIEQLLQDACLTVSGLDVEEPIVNPVYVDLVPGVRQVYREMEKEAFTIIAEQGVEAVNAAVRLNKCLQIASGALYVDDKGAWEKVHDGKMDALESIIEEANGMPVLVAYNFKSSLERLRARFRYGRQLDANPDTIREWNAGRISLLFAHPKSAGHGLNLADGGNILAFFDVDWNLEEHQQIIERIGPQRQKQAGYDRPVFVYPILAKGTVDELVMRRLDGKKSVQEVLLEALKEKGL